ncbi:MAG: hypothetical protein ACK4P4_21150 [Allorhizobium sp.]
MLIRTYADIEKLEGEDALSEAERLLIENSKMGVPTVLGDGVLPKGPSSERSIRVELLRYLILGGDDHCKVHEKGVLLMGAWIEGKLELRSARAQTAIELIQCGFDKPIAAQQAHLESLGLVGSEFPGLNAELAKVRGNLVLDKITCNQMLSISGADIGGHLFVNGANLNGRGGMALYAQSTRIAGGVFLREMKSLGEVSFSGAELEGQLVCEGSQLDGGQRYAFNAQGLRIKGGVSLNKLKSLGTVSFSGAKIGGFLSCQHAHFNGAQGVALNVQNARIDGNALLVHTHSVGEVSFSGGEIGGQLILHQANLGGGSNTALNAQRLTVNGSLFWYDMDEVSGAVNLNAATLGDLVDDPLSWNLSDLSFVGMTYQNLVDPFDLKFRKAWVRRGSQFGGQFHPQPYQQLAKCYRETGHRYEAREILVAKEIEQRKATRKAIREGKARTESWLIPDALAFLNLLWDWTTRLIAGYGYKPWLSLWWLGGMIVAMMLCAQLTWNSGDFAPNSAVILTSQDWKTIADGPSENPAAEWTDAVAPGKDYETFYAFAYALDVVVPVLDLGQTDAWAPSPARGEWGYWMFYLQKIFIVLGWVVTAIAAAAISGMIRRDD